MHQLLVEPERGQTGAKGLRGLRRKGVAVQADISTMAGIDRLYEKFFQTYDKIDLLVNNAGITRMIPFLEVTEENWNEVINLNYKGVYFSSSGPRRPWWKKRPKG